MVGIGVYAESDTFTFFYPVYATLHAAIRDRDAAEADQVLTELIELCRTERRATTA